MKPIYFKLPPLVRDLIRARNVLRDHYRNVLKQNDSDSYLNFTLDGNLVGDLGEAIAVEYFGLVLEKRKSKVGIDGKAPDGRTVQVKATGTNRGPAFRNTMTRADHLLFFSINFESCQAELIFNGPEKIVRSYLPAQFTNQRSLTRQQIRLANSKVFESDRLPSVGECEELPD